MAGGRNDEKDGERSREAKLAEALRSNLRRRKAAAREPRSGDKPPGGELDRD